MNTLEQIIDVALRRADKRKAKNRSLKELKNVSVSKIQSFSDYIINNLDKLIKELPIIEKEHPFYKEIILTYISEDNFKKAIKNISWTRNFIKKLKSQYVEKILYTYDKEKILKLRKEFYGRVISLLEDIEDDYNKMITLLKELRKLPSIDLNLTTIVVAGAPNVGKSTFISNVSTKQPEIANYPFTTKNIHLGHYFLDEKNKIQLIDTPGILKKRGKINPIEKKAILALKYLANIIIFIVDISESCGFSLEKQLNLYNEIIKDCEKPIYVVLSKIDIVENNKVINNLFFAKSKKVFKANLINREECKKILKEIINKENIYNI